MKTIFTIFSLFLFLSCTSKLNHDQQNSTASTLEDVSKNKHSFDFIEFPSQRIGFWVDEKYIDDLVNSKSTKVASESGHDNFYKIYNQGSIMHLNIHEGAGEDLLLMATPDSGVIFSSDTTMEYGKVKFERDTMIVNGIRYIKAPYQEEPDEALHKMVNSSFFSGQYLFHDSMVTFGVDGSISGLDSIRSYHLNLDYNDMGMQYDKIFFQNNPHEKPMEYIYEFHADTLFIIKSVCKTQESDFCVEIEKGEIVYQFLKQ